MTGSAGVAQMVVRKWSVSDLEEASGLLSVVARLDEQPPAELADCFGADYDGPAWPADLEKPTLDSVLISFRVRPEDVLRYRESLRERLAAANRRYSGVIIPRARALAAAEQEREARRLRIIAEAQRLFDLDPSLTAAVGSSFDEVDGSDHGSGLAERVAERGAWGG